MDAGADLPGVILSGAADGDGGGGAADDFPQSGARAGVGILFVLLEPGWVEHWAADAGRAERLCVSQRRGYRDFACHYDRSRGRADADCICFDAAAVPESL